jgi:hypothetical protein
MSTADSAEGPSKEEQILRVMRRVLTAVVKDTATPPGLKHPLRDATIEDIRQCLALISARERELAAAAGRPWNYRPHFADESPPGERTVVPITRIGRPDKDKP